MDKKVDGAKGSSEEAEDDDADGTCSKTGVSGARHIDGWVGARVEEDREDEEDASGDS